MKWAGAREAIIVRKSPGSDRVYGYMHNFRQLLY